ncbi:MAG: type II toxin-antitoxin system HicA family toxin [Nitrospirota bacterium]
MKRHEVIKHLNRYGCKFLREGKQHTVYYNLANHKTSTIPRHIEIDNNLVDKICKDLDIPRI